MSSCPNSSVVTLRMYPTPAEARGVFEQGRIADHGGAPPDELFPTEQPDSILDPLSVAQTALFKCIRLSFDDDSPVANPGTPEEREYRIIAVIADNEIDQPTAVVPG